MKECTLMAKSKVKENFCGQMVLATKENSMITILKDREFTIGQMEDSTKETG
jgi:hypothetical protein